MKMSKRSAMSSASSTLATLAMIAMLVNVDAKGAEEGTAPDSKAMRCEGCRAAVAATLAKLGSTKRSEDNVNEVLENADALCAEAQFQNPSSQWQFPPPMTSKACKDFLNLDGTPGGPEPDEAIAKAFVSAAADASLSSIVMAACMERAGVCSEGECSAGTPASSKGKWKAAKPGKGRELFSAAIAKDSPEDALKALEQGADIDARDPGSGQTPLMQSCLMGKHKMVEFLLQEGADWQIGEKDGYTCLHGAGFQGRPQVAEAAVAFGLPAADMHGDGFLPIHRATWGMTEGHAEVARVLVEKGGQDVDAASSSGVTPLLGAISSPRGLNLHMVKALVAVGADVNAVDKDGKPALMKLMESGKSDYNREKAIKALLKAGASTSMKDRKGVTVEERGRQLGYGHIFDKAKK